MTAAFRTGRTGDAKSPAPFGHGKQRRVPGHADAPRSILLSLAIDALQRGCDSIDRRKSDGLPTAWGRQRRATARSLTSAQILTYAVSDEATASRPILFLLNGRAQS